MRYLFLILLFASCKCPRQAVDQGGQEKTQAAPLTLVLTDSYGGAETESLQVFRSQGGLQKFFAQVNKTRKPGLPVPVIDFNKNMVLVYSPGKTTAGTLPGLITLGEKEGNILVGTKKEGEQTTNASAALTQPFAIYTMPRTDKEVVMK